MRKEDIKIGMKVLITAPLSVHNGYVGIVEKIMDDIVEVNMLDSDVKDICTCAHEYIEPYDQSSYNTTFGKGTIETNDPFLVKVLNAAAGNSKNIYNGNNVKYHTLDEVEDMLIDSKKTTPGFINNENESPITQEFIESFGFKFTGGYVKGRFIREYEKVNDDSIKFSLMVEAIDNIDYYSLFNELYNLFVFSEMKISTQSELRFLLTKGKIDCSK